MNKETESRTQSTEPHESQGLPAPFIRRAPKPNPMLGQNFEAMDPLERPQGVLPFRPGGTHSHQAGRMPTRPGRERPATEGRRIKKKEWLARMTDHIPDPGKHRTLFYGHCANRVRGDRGQEVHTAKEAEDKAPKKRRCTASWARLVSKVYHADPLTCRRCGAKLKAIAYLHDQVAISRILARLGLSPREKPKPPPAVREVVRVPLNDEGLEIGDSGSRRQRAPKDV